MPAGISKATGIQRLADHLGIGMAELIAFVDGNNDIDMMNAAGLGVAVANSVPSLLVSADVVVGSNDDEGPACYLESLFSDDLHPG